jgi:hypothetical protein
VASGPKPPPEPRLATVALWAVVAQLVCVAPWLLLSLIAGTPGEDGLESALGVGFSGIPAGAAVALVVTVVRLNRRSRSLLERSALSLLALVLAFAGWIGGWVAWVQIAERDCADQYECPF